jgi:hypothetical protein
MAVALKIFQKSFSDLVAGHNVILSQPKRKTGSGGQTGKEGKCAEKTRSLTF